MSTTTVKITAAERQQINAIVDRHAGLCQLLDRTTSDYWKGRANQLRTEVEADDGADAEALWSKIEELKAATANRADAKNGELQAVRSILKKRTLAVAGEITPIIVACAEKHVAPLIEDSEKAQAAQDADHKARGIPAAPCPAAAAIREKADAIMRSARSGDLRLVGMD